MPHSRGKNTKRKVFTNSPDETRQKGDQLRSTGSPRLDKIRRAALRQFLLEEEQVAEARGPTSVANQHCVWDKEPNIIHQTRETEWLLISIFFVPEATLVHPSAQSWEMLTWNFRLRERGGRSNGWWKRPKARCKTPTSFQREADRAFGGKDPQELYVSNKYRSQFTLRSPERIRNTWRCAKWCETGTRMTRRSLLVCRRWLHRFW